MEWKKNKLDKVKFSQDSGIAALQHNPRYSWKPPILQLTRLVHFLFERLAPVRKVARVDANLFQRFRHPDRHLGLEVHVRAQGDVVTLLEQALPDLVARFGFFHALHGDSHQVKAFVRATHDLQA